MIVTVASLIAVLLDPSVIQVGTSLEVGEVLKK